MKLKFNYKKKRDIFCLLIIMTIQCTVLNKVVAQNRALKKITGIILSVDDNQPILGATVNVKGKKVIAISDFDGNFSIKANDDDVLIVTYLGMEDKNVKITSENLTIKMHRSFEDLEEVVVVGYGTVKKKEVTGAVAQVKAKDIEQFVTPDLASSLQGQISGVNIVSSSGEPGSQSQIQIRGITSLSGSNTPLFVVDGIPQEGDPGLSANEIETIDVLKDAASAAVYGTRGSAGVILITTKQGKDGRMKVSLNSSYGIQSLGEGIPLLNTKEELYVSTTATHYLESLGRQYSNNFLSQPEWLTNDNDFRELVLVDNAQTKNVNLNITGGTKSFSYNVAGGYINTDGTLIGSSYKRYNGRANTTFKSDNWKINTSIGFVLEDNQRSSGGLIVSAIRYNPYFPIIDNTSDTFFTDGNGNLNTPLNSLAQNLKRKDVQKTDKINVSLSVSRKITDELSFTSRVGVNITDRLRSVFRPRFELVNIDDDSSDIDPIRSGVAVEASRLGVFGWDGLLNYNKKIGDHSIKLLASMSLNERSFEEIITSRNGVVSNEIKVINGATQDETSDSGNNYVRKNAGFLGRIQYGYKGTYLLSALVRRDASSKFGKDFRWGTFPSVSLGWNVSNEKFWDGLSKTINNFKLRYSHGTVGNDNFADYSFSSAISFERDYIFDPNDGSFTLGSAIVQNANPNVKWETSVSNNFGVDISLFKNKVIFTTDYYVTNKRDMLFPVRLPGSIGVVLKQPDDVVLNVGNMTNKGLEMSLKYRFKNGDSNFSIGTTFTKNTNVITKISEGIDIINNTSSVVLQDATTVFKVGREAGAFYLFQTSGTIKTDEELEDYRKISPNAEKGDLIFKDQLTVDTDNDGINDAADGVINNSDRVYSGSGLPDYEVGMNLSWKYKRLDLSMNWFASVGAKIINGTKAETFSRGRHKELFNQWTPSNPNSDIPFFAGRKHVNYSQGNTDRWLENGDYLRLKLITLGYTFSKDFIDRLNVTNFRLYVSAQNPLTFTEYSGFDPEIGGNVARRGIDNGRYPLTSLYSLGLNLSF